MFVAILSHFEPWGKGGKLEGSQELFALLRLKPAAASYPREKYVIQGA